MKVLHSWLKEYLGESTPSALDIERALTFHAFEIEEIVEKGQETMIDVKILPDRAADCLSHLGIAREIATCSNLSLTHDPFRETVSLEPKTQSVTVTIEDDTACRRLAAAHVQGVEVGASPLWLRERLEALGQRSINNVVDATNYVMLSLGQPLHAYDADKLSLKEGTYALTARRARSDEKITTLAHEDCVLNASIQVIADGHTDVPLAIAGIKGGAHAEITEATTALVLEAGNFDPQLTRKAAQFLKLPTDAAKRFENNISPDVIPYALTELVRLVIEIAGGSVRGFVDLYPHQEQNEEVRVSLVDINARLGLSLNTSAVSALIDRLGFSKREESDAWYVRAPFERRDIRIPADVIEEVGRVYGYEHVTAVMPNTVALTEIHAQYYYSEKIRHVLIAQGFSEVITSSFRKKDTIELQNALASDKGYLRSTLTTNLTEALDRNMPNVDLLGLSRVALFEIGTVFGKTSDNHDVSEHVSLGIAVRTKQQGYTPKDDAHLKEIEEILETSLGGPLNAKIEHGVLECDLTALVGILPVPHSYEEYVTPAQVVFKPYSTYPFVSRDIALWVPEDITDTHVRTLIEDNAGPLLLSIRLFDTFSKDGRTSYAFRLIFQSSERTLTDAEVGESMQHISAALTGKHFEIR